MVSPRRWDIAWAELDPTRGHEQAGRRPVLVFSNEVVSSRIGLVAVVPITSLRENRRIYPTEVLLPIEATGLAKISLVMGHQVRTISMQRLLLPATHRLTDTALCQEVERVVCLWLDLGVRSS